MKRQIILNLVAYSPKIAGLFEELDEMRSIDIIRGRDLNIKLPTFEGAQFLTFSWFTS